MLSSESLQVAEEVVLESSSNKLGDIYTFVAKGCFPHTMHPLRKKKNLKGYAQKFIIDEGKLYYEQQNSVKQLVLANMTSAYKQEKKKKRKRRTHRSPSVTFKLSEPQETESTAVRAWTVACVMKGLKPHV
ncbi:hypothetical protein F7725_026073 [Dissostichus mawsoni]|uniref:Uncharacterized protein n=1 Tax=Dissostichus mawsoni TaxID=36200 RepID=A0A7J5X7I2_DISMA|nr:hypothetical protein F7725_026073 [Dissostichus mawsoni]